MSNYSKINLPSDARVELHDALGLTGAEVSVNSLPQVHRCLSFIPISRMRRYMPSYPGAA